MNDIVLSDITTFFNDRGLSVTELNKSQALVPETATVMRNPFGTAPGLWFEKNNKIIISMPGVPFEMQNMITGFVLPRLRERIKDYFIIHRTVLTTGIGESFLAERISSWEDQLPDNIKLAYLPSPGIIKLRLSAMGSDKKSIEDSVERQIETLKAIIPQYYWGLDDEKLEKKIGDILVLNNQTLVTAESCTGGYISHLLTSIPGSSAYYKGSVVAYSNQLKKQILEVDATLLEKHGAVSKEVVEAMAVNTRRILAADYSIAVSGIAGPGGGTPDKPVGTVWLAVASSHNVTSKLMKFGDTRERNIIRISIAALAMLYKVLKSQSNG